MPESIAALVADPTHTGPLDGATRVGEAAADGRIVRVGLWWEAGRVVRARFKASTCAALIASAEAACRLLEEGVLPGEVDAKRLENALLGLHPLHRDRPALVARAVRLALPPPQEEHR